MDCTLVMPNVKNSPNSFCPRLQAFCVLLMIFETKQLSLERMRPHDRITQFIIITIIITIRLMIYYILPGRIYSCPEGKGTRGLQGPIRRCPTSPPHSHIKDSHSTGITLLFSMRVKQFQPLFHTNTSQAATGGH